ncbi:MAG: undecaprenyldiphospho-muramoylpentapeptide beta-N-acetylglucosaminyltransferase [Proteobacteria bacterium]|nr:undecaprenyldiphospho-muramoylpentapeptide beta-N-acetylglucosaminyltransferase [Pseudomonadota bacterium]
MKIILTGGGTAGHVTPNVALIEALRDSGAQIGYVGSYDGIERQIIARQKVRYWPIASGKLRRYFSWQNFIDPLLIAWGLLQSLVIVFREKPDVVFSKGGFVSVPLVYAARFWRVPVICHESDVTPGLANRLCFPVVQRVCVNFAETGQYLSDSVRARMVVTGTPVRRSLVRGDPVRGLQSVGLDAGKPLLLIFGGSLGSARINGQVRRVLDELLSRYHIVHVVGAGNVDESLSGRAGYQQRDYLDAEFGDVLAAADVVISRAGANSLYELLVTRTPHILIPLPSLASRGDQLDNARTFLRLGYSNVLEESDLNDLSLVSLIDQVYGNRAEITARLAEFTVVDSVAVISDIIHEVGDKA